MPESVEQKLCDYSENGKFPWLKERKENEFYDLHLQYNTDSHNEVLALCENEEQRKFIEDPQPEVVRPKKFYEIIAEMSNQERIRYIRNCIVKFATVRKEGEARITDFPGENVTKRMDTAEAQGKYAADMFVRGRKPRKD